MAQLAFLALSSNGAAFSPKMGWHKLAFWHFGKVEFVPKCQSSCHAKRAITRVPVAKCQSAKSDTGEYPSKT